MVAGLTATMLLIFASLAGIGFAGGSTSAKQYHGQYGKTKVTICHKGHTITVAQIAWLTGHSRHHDTLGACPQTTTAAVTTAAAPTAATAATPAAATHGKSAAAPGHNK